MKNNGTAISARTSLLVLLSLIISSLHFYLSPWRSLLMIPCYLGLPLSLLLDIEDEVGLKNFLFCLQRKLNSRVFLESNSKLDVAE